MYSLKSGLVMSRSPGRSIVDDAADVTGHAVRGAAGHHDDAVGEEDGLLDRVGDEHHGRLGLDVDALELGLQIRPGERVERAERLVHQQHRGLVREHAGDRDALLHAAGELAGVLVGEAGEADGAR